MRINDAMRLLEPYNPWWYDKTWYDKDIDLRNVRESILKRKPRIYFHIRNNLGAIPLSGILTIRGPRRIGKTTLIKLIVEYLIKSRNFNPRHVIYISLDYHELRRISLIELINTFIDYYGGNLYLLLDEVSMNKDWALILKNLVDQGIYSKNVMIIATGSHSMDLAEARSKLSGRQGACSKVFNLSGNLVYYPLRFSEVVESLYEDFNDYLIRKKLRKPRNRYNILKSLQKGIIAPEVEKIYDLFYSTLQEAFLDYLIHGGYPKVIDIFNKQKTIPSNEYFDLAKIIVADGKESLNLREETLVELLKQLTNPNRLSGVINFSKIMQDIFVIDKTGMGKKISKRNEVPLKEYINYLETTKIFLFSYQERKYCEINYESNVKNHIRDPFLYFSLFSYVNHITQPFLYAKEFIEDHKKVGLLVESVVASHVAMIPFLFEHISYYNERENLFYSRAKNRETDIIICFRKGNYKNRFEIEVKYQSHVDDQSIAPPYNTNLYKFVLTKSDLDISMKRKLVLIPIPIFLIFL